MAWPKSGTVSVTNGSPVVTGSGTNFFGAAQAGWAFVGPDGRVYEVLTADSATQITLASNYQGATASGQVYALFPTMSLARDLVASVQSLISNYQGIADGPGAGKFAGDVVKQGDEDTGLSWPASNTVALKAGGTEQLRLVGGGASGAAVQNAPDDVDGDTKLVRMQGAKSAALSRFGVYKSPSVNFDIDTTEPGFAGLVHDGNPGTWPRPSYGAFVYITTERTYYSSSSYQTATYGYTSAGTPNMFRQYVRVRSSDGIWGAWYQIYNGFSLLGTVSQSGGLPTGAVIERGSNANGEYVRLADGTQICSSGVGSSSTTGDDTWVFPAAFVSGQQPRYLILPGGTSGTARFGTWVTGDHTQFTYSVYGTDGARKNTYCHRLAIGRWF